ncbi:MAG: porin family protein [Bacteroidales bacterium]
MSLSKKYWITIVLLILFTNTYGQLMVGVKGGATFGTTTENKYIGSEIIYQTGVIVNLYLLESRIGGLSLQPEVLYSTKNTWQEFSCEIQDSYRLSYIEVPIGIMYTPPIKKVQPYIGFSPYISFLVSEKKSVNNGRQNSSNFTNIDWGIKFGLGCEICRFQLVATYRYGIQNISKVASDVLYSRGLDISFGYFFLR